MAYESLSVALAPITGMFLFAYFWSQTPEEEGNDWKRTIFFGLAVLFGLVSTVVAYSLSISGSLTNLTPILQAVMAVMLLLFTFVIFIFCLNQFVKVVEALRGALGGKK